jgi:hypothetical protein
MIASYNRPVTEPPDMDAWAAWRPEFAADLLAECEVPWAVAGGWAIDLHHGRQTREHGDLEIAIPRSDFGALKPFLREYQIFAAGNGSVDPLTPETEAAKRQMWIYDGEHFRLDVFLEPGDHETWVSHRDTRVTLPFIRARCVSSNAIPYLAPETVLFMKAKHSLPKDEADFALTLPTLDSAALSWLTASLELAHPDHPWIRRCREAS